MPFPKVLFSTRRETRPRPTPRWADCIGKWIKGKKEGGPVAHNYIIKVRRAIWIRETTTGTRRGNVGCSLQHFQVGYDVIPQGDKPDPSPAPSTGSNNAITLGSLTKFEIVSKNNLRFFLRLSPKNIEEMFFTVSWKSNTQNVVSNLPEHFHQNRPNSTNFLPISTKNNRFFHFQ